MVEELEIGSIEWGREDRRIGLASVLRQAGKLTDKVPEVSASRQERVAVSLLVECPLPCRAIMGKEKRRDGSHVWLSLLHQDCTVRAKSHEQSPRTVRPRSTFWADLSMA